MIQFVDLLVDYLAILSIRSFRQKPLEAVSPEIWSIRALHIAYLEERRLRVNAALKSENNTSGNFCLWNPESEEIIIVKLGILGFRIRNAAQGIRNPIDNWNPESKFPWQRLESSSWNPESTACNRDPKTVLDSLTWPEGRNPIIIYMLFLFYLDLEKDLDLDKRHLEWMKLLMRSVSSTIPSFLNKIRKRKRNIVNYQCSPFSRNKMFEISHLAPRRKQLINKDKQQVKKIITRLSSRRH